MKTTSRTPSSALVLLALAALGAPLAATAACSDAAPCVQTASFNAQVTDFRTSISRSYRVVDATVHIENRSDHPLSLVYVSGSGMVIDDQGNRYAIDDFRNANAVRAIGIINRSTFDPKFRLQPGEGSDARFEFAFNPGNAIVGTVFRMELTLREIDSLAGGQQKPGREHVLQFRSLSNQPGGMQAAAAAPASAVAGAATAPSPAVAVGGGDPCAGNSRCRSAGPFTAEVSQLSSTTQRNQQLVSIRLQLRNTSAAPLVLAYVTNSGVMVDDSGNRYVVDWRFNNHVQGIGQVSRNKADPQFVLNPGESRSVMLEYSRYVGKSVIGTVFAPDFALRQLEILPSQQVREVREYSLGFSGLSAGSFGTGATNEAVGEAARQLADGLKSLFKKK